MKPLIDQNKETYNTICERNKENGAKGGRPTKTEDNPEKPSGLFTNPEKLNRIEYNIKEKNIKKEVVKKKNFVAPTLKEIEEYATLRGREDLTKKFYDFFSESDWFDSNNKKVMRWKGKFVTWESYHKKEQKTYEL